MPSLILKTRLEMLSANLRNVSAVLELARRRSQQIARLRQLLFDPESVHDVIGRAQNRIEKSMTDLNNKQLQQNEYVKNAKDQLGEAKGSLAQLAARVELFDTALDALFKSYVELGTRKFGGPLSQEANESIQDLKYLIDDLQTPGSSSAGWAKEKTLAEKSEPLFAEYVDLLRGVALRETGVESGICALADRLLDECARASRQDWKSLAIPAYRGPTGLTPAQIIRLGFPEWTIWALPLAAYEFGRIIVSQDRRLGDKLDAEVPEDDHPSRPVVVACFADAFATYTVGPAYACSAILMRLDPRPATPGGPPVDGPRAQMIFEMIARADERAGNTISFKEVLDTLRSVWTEAVREARGADGAVPANGLAERAPELADFFWKWAENASLTAKYHPEAWPRAEKLQALLLRSPDDTPPAPKVTAADLADVRDVLNAAWRCRLENPERTEDIAAAAQRLWQDVGTELKETDSAYATHGPMPGVQSTRRN